MGRRERMIRRVAARYLQADSRGNMIRTLGLTRDEADLFHRVARKLAFPLAKWWKESGEKDVHKFLDTPFANWVIDNPGKAGNWRKMPFHKAESMWEAVALKNPEDSGKMMLKQQGWKWIKYPRDAFGMARCPVWVRDFLGHCGQTPSGEMVVLFTPQGKPKVTGTLSHKGLLYDIVGQGQTNLKPKYKKHIQNLADKFDLKVKWPAHIRTMADWTEDEVAANQQRALVERSYLKMDKLLKVVSGPFEGMKAMVAGRYQEDDTVKVLLGDMDDTAFQLMTKDHQERVSIFDLADF